MTDISLESPRRDVRIIGVVGSAHFTSHFFQLALPPLFPLIHSSLGLSYEQLGALMAVFFAVSAIGQVFAGIAVDRFGPQVVLPIGMTLIATGILIVGVAPNWPVMLVFAGMAGLGNCVYHPADYSILTSRVSPVRVARGYSVHTVAGTLGWAAAPITMGALAAGFGWRRALIIAGACGLLAAVLALLNRSDLVLPTRKRSLESSPSRPTMLSLLASPPILLAFVFFVLLALALGAVQSFLPTLLPKVQTIDFEFATATTTFYLIASAVGSLVGGYVADFTKNYEAIIAAGLTGAATLMLLLGFVGLPEGLILLAAASGGALVGLTVPCRDMLVRASTPTGSAGRVFGFVYSGLDIGSLIVPLIIGAMLDHGYARLPFLFIAGALIATLVPAVAVRRR